MKPESRLSALLLLFDCVSSDELLFKKLERPEPTTAVPWLKFKTIFSPDYFSYRADFEAGAELKSLSRTGFLYRILYLKVDLIGDLFEYDRPFRKHLSDNLIPPCLVSYFGENSASTIFGAAPPLNTEQFECVLKEAKDMDGPDHYYRAVAELVSFVPLGTLGPGFDHDLQSILSVSFPNCEGIVRLMREALDKDDESRKVLAERLHERDSVRQFLLQFCEFEYPIRYLYKNWKILADDFLRGTSEQINLKDQETWTYLIYVKTPLFVKRCAKLQYTQLVSLVEKESTEGEFTHWNTLKDINCWEMIRSDVKYAINYHFKYEELPEASFIVPQYYSTGLQGWNHLLPGYSWINMNWFRSFSQSFVSQRKLIAWGNGMIKKLSTVPGRDPDIVPVLIRTKQLIIFLLQRADKPQDIKVKPYFEKVTAYFERSPIREATFKDFSLLENYAPKHYTSASHNTLWWHVVKKMKLSPLLKAEFIGTLQIHNISAAVLLPTIRSILENVDPSSVHNGRDTSALGNRELRNILLECQITRTNRQCHYRLKEVFKDFPFHLKVLQEVFIDPRVVPKYVQNTAEPPLCYNGFRLPETDSLHCPLEHRASQDLYEALKVTRYNPYNQLVFYYEHTSPYPNAGPVLEKLFQEAIHGKDQILQVVKDPISGRQVATPRIDVDPTVQNLLGHMFCMGEYNGIHLPVSLSEDFLEAVFHKDNEDIISSLFSTYYSNLDYHLNINDGLIEPRDLKRQFNDIDDNFLNVKGFQARAQLMESLHQLVEQIRYSIGTYFKFPRLSRAIIRRGLGDFLQSKPKKPYKVTNGSLNVEIDVPSKGRVSIYLGEVVSSFLSGLTDNELDRFLALMNGDSLGRSSISVEDDNRFGGAKLVRLGDGYSDLITVSKGWSRGSDLLPLRTLFKRDKEALAQYRESIREPSSDPEDNHYMSPKRYQELFVATFAKLADLTEIGEFRDIFDPEFFLFYPGPFPEFVKPRLNNVWPINRLNDISIVVGYLIAHVALFSDN